MSEIEFLTHFSEPDITVVYAGAAPGTHINYLADLFPQVRFVLVDPAPFKCKSSDRVIVRQEFFTDEVRTSCSEFQLIWLPSLMVLGCLLTSGGPRVRRHQHASHFRYPNRPVEAHE